MIKFPKPSKSQSSLIRHSAIYFRSTWIAGLVLIAFSVAWWLYLNWNVVRHADEQYWISYEGDIYGVVDDDLLDSPPDSRIYMWAKKDQDFHYRFLVLNHSPVSVEQPFSILWFSKTRIGAQSSGVGPKSVKFHLDPGKTIYQLKREGSEISIVANN